MARGWLSLAAGLLAGVHLVLGLWLVPGWMFSKYPDAARLLVAGTLGPEQGSDFSPLYLLFNVVSGPLTLRWLQALAGAGCVLLAAVIGARAFGRTTGLVAAALVALLEPLMLYEATLEPDVWVAALSFAAIAALVSGGSEARRALVAGALLGVAAALRPSGWLFGGALCLLLAVRVLRGERGALRPLGLAAAALVACAVVPSLLIRTVVPTPLGATMSAGQVLVIGNRPESTGVGATFSQLAKLVEQQKLSPDRPDYSHVLYRDLARASAGRELSAPQVEAFWAGKALAFARQAPGAFAALWARKLTFFLLGPEAHDLVEVRRAQERLRGWPLIGSRLLGALGLAGLLLGAWRREKVGWLALGAGAALALGVVFYVVSRYRLAGALPLAVLAARWVTSVVERWRSPPELLRAAVPLAAVGLWGWSASFLHESSRVLQRAGTVSSEAIALNEIRSQGDVDRATGMYMRVQAAQPFASLVLRLRGIPFESPQLALESGERAAGQFGFETRPDLFFGAELARRAGRCDQAEAAAQAAEGYRLAVFDRQEDPQLLIAQCALASGQLASGQLASGQLASGQLASGQLARAREAVARSLERWPATLEGLALASAGARAAHDEAAVASLQAELFAVHDRLTAAYALARADNRFGNFGAALEEAEQVLAAVPDAAVADYERAVALAGLGRAQDAVRAYGRALAEFPDYGFATRPLDGAIDAELARAPGDPEVLSVASEHALRQHRLDAAVDLASRASAAFGPFAPAWHTERLRFLQRVLRATPRR